MGTKKATIKMRITKAKLASTKQWRKERDVEVKKTKDDPGNKRYVVEIKVSAPSDYLIGQFKGQLMG